MEFRKPRGLETKAPYERELCGLLSGLGAKFGSSTIIKHEFDAEKLERYIGLLSLFLIFLPLMHILANCLSVLELFF